MSLPVRIKANVRDVWNKPDSEVQKTINAVKKLLGTSFEVEPEWAILWNALSKHFPDPANFVPIVASIFVAWCKSLIEIAEDERNEEWTETLLEKLKLTRGVGLKVLIEVGDGKPTCDWIDKTMAFDICLPKSVVPRSHTMIAAFHDDLRRAFLPPVKEPTVPVRGAASGAKIQDDDGAFTDAGSEFGGSSLMAPSTTTGHFASQPARLDVLPNVKTLERPEDLMKFPPYHMIVQHSSYGKSVTIQCSHQPSLDLISEYFTRWVKRNHNSTNKPPAASIEMRESCFGLGLMYDRLEFVIDSYDHKHGLSPALMLTFVESVLGYRMTYNDSSSWTFRRDTGFKS